MNLSPDWTIIPMWFIFVGSFLVLHFLIFKPTLKIMSERERLTGGLRNEAGRFEKEAFTLAQEYETKMVAARNEARALRDSIIKKAHDEQHATIQKAHEDSAQKLEDITIKIAEEGRKAREELKFKASEIADAITQKLINRKAA